MNSFVGLLFGHMFNRKVLSELLVAGMVINVCCSVVCFYEVAVSSGTSSLLMGQWINGGVLFLDWFFVFDKLCVVMFIVVNVVSLCVHVYSVRYMDIDPFLIKFMSYLSFFTFFMLLLVSSGNLPQLFIGWEGVGLASFLLISFWNTRLLAVRAAIKAILVNRVGDMGLMLAFAFIFYQFRSLDFGVIFALAPEFSKDQLVFLGTPLSVLAVSTTLIFVGAVGKSAQLGLHMWLPDAMEGPTPVSALIHAATMVTAGVFVIIRCSPLFEYTPGVLTAVAVVGGLTAFFAGLCGCIQSDLKKVIAYSTCSQLGYMVFICGLSGYSVGIFHLVNHAFFKALLFLSAGSVIHAVSDEQDMRKMGGLSILLPATYLMVFVGSLALMGFPFLTGFYSKDVLLEGAFAVWGVSGRLVYWLGISTAVFTAFYSTRLLYMVFLSRSNGRGNVYPFVVESDWYILAPLVVLYLGSLFSGYVCKDMFVGLGSDFWCEGIFVMPGASNLLDGEFAPWYVKMLPFFVSMFGVCVSLGLVGVFKFYLNAWPLFVERLRDVTVVRDVSYARSLFNFMVVYDASVCTTILPRLIGRFIYIRLFAAVESIFLYVSFLLKNVLYKFLRGARGLHNGQLLWYFGMFYGGAQLGLAVVVILIK